VGYDACRSTLPGTRHQGDDTPDVLTDDVADVATGLVLMAAGLSKADRFVRAGQWTQRGFELTTKLAAAPPASSASAASQGDREAASSDRACASRTRDGRRSRALPTCGSCRTLALARDRTS